MNNKRFTQDLPGESFTIEVPENLPLFLGESQSVEVVSPSKIYFCKACKLIFQCRAKLDSHRTKERGCTFEDSTRSEVFECLDPTNKLD